MCRGRRGAQVDDVVNGFNGTVFAYGQTGSGKTFTMFGPESEHKFTGTRTDPPVRPPARARALMHRCLRAGPQRGVIPRAAEYLFDELQKKCAPPPLKGDRPPLTHRAATTSCK
jgi:hypothetical protein